jgi:dATP pyrophosphohydrolase
MPRISSQVIELCVFKFDRDTPRYLLLQRSSDERLYPGIWQFISGSIEASEKAADAAIRELFEETGMKPTAFWNVPTINSFYDHGQDVLNIYPLFAAQVDGDGELRLSSEHSGYGWFPFEEALHRLVWPGQRDGLRIVHEFIVGGQEAGRLTRLI